MIKIILISLIVMFIMTVVVFYSSLGHLGVQSVRRKMIYTFLGTIFSIKMSFNFKRRMQIILRHFESRNKKIPNKSKLILMVFLDIFNVKRNIQALAYSSAAFEEEHPAQSKVSNPIQAGIEDYDYIRESFKKHKISG